MTPPPSRLLTDLTWLALLGATGLAWLVFDGTLTTRHIATALMALMLLKSALILAVFMDLARASKLTLFGLLACMAIVAVGVAVQI